MKLAARTVAVSVGVALVGVFSTEDAHACSPKAFTGGYLTKLAVRGELVDDPASQELCPRQIGGCGPQNVRARASSQFLAVALEISSTAAGDELAWVKPGASIVLKDGSGGVIATSEVPSIEADVSFEKIGAQVCVTTTSEDGEPASAKEVCAPVPITTLAISEEQQAQHRERVEALCAQNSGVDGGAADAGAADASADAGAGPENGRGDSPGSASPGSEDGGCSTTGGSSSWGLAVLGLLGLAFAFATRRARVRRDGGWSRDNRGA